MTAASKNIDKLDDIENEENNTYHRTIKVKPVEVKDNTYIDSKKLMITILNLKLVIMLEYHDAKTFLVKDILQIDLNTIL